MEFFTLEKAFNIIKSHSASPASGQREVNREFHRKWKQFVFLTGFFHRKWGKNVDFKPDFSTKKILHFKLYIKKKICFKLDFSTKK